MRLFLCLAPLLLLPLRSAAAEPAHRCTPLREGEAACLDGKLCECRFDPGGTLTGRPPGTRWNCGALRPACGGPPPAEGGLPADRAASPVFPPPYGPAPGWR